MNSQILAQRTAILEQMAALQAMEQGSLKAEYRTQPDGGQTGPYFKHQVWREGANVTQRIAPADAPALAEAIANRQQFEALAAEFIAVTVAHTRQAQFPGSLKKKMRSATSPRKPSSRR